MFTPSTIAVSAAAQEIAGTVGATGDSEMTDRAGRSLFAGIKYLNGKQNWAWLMTEYAPITVVAPFSMLAASASGGGAILTATAAGHGVEIDDWLTGNGIGAGFRVLATSTATITLNASVVGFTGTATANYTVNRDFYDLPTDWKQPYSVRLLGTNTWLMPAQRRAYDRSVGSEYQTGTPVAYDLFASFQKNKIRLLPSPSASDTLQIRYYRRMTVPTTTATASVLDIPQDYDATLIAWSKWHFLTDKADGRGDQAAIWLTFAQEGIKTMLADQTRQPDESLAFIPSSVQFNWANVNDTRNLPWIYS